MRVCGSSQQYQVAVDCGPHQLALTLYQQLIVKQDFYRNNHPQGDAVSRVAFLTVTLQFVSAVTT
jgi:hypothetical protein